MNLMTSALVPIYSATVIPKKVDKADLAVLIALYPNPSLNRPVKNSKIYVTSGHSKNIEVSNVTKFYPFMDISQILFLG